MDCGMHKLVHQCLCWSVRCLCFAPSVIDGFHLALSHRHFIYVRPSNMESLHEHICVWKNKKNKCVHMRTHTRARARAQGKGSSEMLQSDNQASSCKLNWQWETLQTDSRDTEQKKRWMEMLWCSVKPGEVACRLSASTSHGPPLSSSPAVTSRWTETDTHRHHTNTHTQPSWETACGGQRLSSNINYIDWLHWRIMLEGVTTHLH